MALSTSRKWLLAATFLILSFLYFTTSTFLSNSNEGSHYALVKSLVHGLSPELKENMSYTRWVDYAVKDGKAYSDRLPGTAFITIPFYVFGEILQELGLARSHDLGQVAVVLMPNLCLLATLVALFLFFYWRGIAFWHNYLACVALGISTLCWHEATHLFSHAAAIFFVFVPVLIIISIRDIYLDRIKALVAVAMLSYSAVIELQNILVFLPLVVYMVAAGKIALLPREHRGQNVAFAAASGLLVALALGLLLAYNYWAFHELTFKSNKYNPNFPEELSFFTSLSGNFWKGLDLLFTNFGNPGVYLDFSQGRGNSAPGLFVVSPVLLLSVIGFWWMFKSMKAEVFLFVAIIVINVVIAAFHKTTLTRHISTAMPFMLVPIVFLLERFKSRASRVTAWFVVLLATIYGSARVLYVTLTYYERDFFVPFNFVRFWWFYLIFYGLLALSSWCLSRTGMLAWLRAFWGNESARQ